MDKFFDRTLFLTLGLHLVRYMGTEVIFQEYRIEAFQRLLNRPRLSQQFGAIHLFVDGVHQSIDLSPKNFEPMQGLLFELWINHMFIVYTPPPYLSIRQLADIEKPSGPHAVRVNPEGTLHLYPYSIAEDISNHKNNDSKDEKEVA